MGDLEATTVADNLRRQRWHYLALIALIALTYRHVVPGMVADWNNDPNYSHGFLVPLVAGYFVWQRWPDLQNMRLKPNNYGFVLVLLSQIMLIFGFIATEYFSMRVSLVVLVAGIVLFCFGWMIFKSLALPLGFLFFMVPLPYIVYDAMAFPLKLLVAKFSVAVLKLMGISVLREGNIIMFPQTVLEVADACSGLRSLMSLLALAVAYAFVSQRSNTKRCILVAAAVPIAIATNMLRVIATGVLAQYYGAAAAEGFFHEFAGISVFALAMVFLFLIGALLNKWGDV